VIQAALAAAEVDAPAEADWPKLERLAEGSVGRLLGLWHAGGLDLYDRIAKLTGALPRVDWRAAHALSDELQPAAAQPRFELFFELLLTVLARLIRAQAAGEGGPEEQELARRLIGEERLASFAGTHAIGHTRMATESAVTIAGSHPFSTGRDTCLVHNGSLSNHNRLRETLRRHGERFQTENDTEVAAGYLSWRMKEGDSLELALEHALDDLDGFYTFVVGTRDGFAVLRDPIACKPAVMAETDAWVAFGSEFRALAALPGIEAARIWEPAPATVYAWSRS